MTAAHKNVNEDIWDEGDVRTHTEEPEEEQKARTGLDNVSLTGGRQ